jgi:flagellar motor switch protein FliG
MANGSIIGGEALNGAQKAAVLLMSLGAELSAGIFKSLSEAEIEKLTTEISRLASVGPGTTKEVLTEFDHLAQAQAYLTQGGLEYASDVLQRALGPKKSREVLDRLRNEIQQPTAFEIVKRVDPKNLLEFVRREHPQTIALILANMDAKQSAHILSELSPELQSDVILRIATMDKTSPEVVKQIESILEDRFSSMFTQEVSVSGGAKSVAEIMNRLDRSTEKNLISMLQEQDGQLAESIRRLMFTFEDIVHVDDRGIQKILKEIEQHDLVLALKAASPEVAGKIYKNMSERASSLVKEEISFLGPVRLRDVEESQRRIVDAVRRMEEQGEIIVQGRGGQDDIVI